MMFCKEDDFAETPIGDFPKDWRVVSLGDIAKVKGGKRVRKGEKLVDFRTGFPYIRVVDFKNGTVDVSRVKYLLPETHEKIKNYTISSNDVYISIAGTVGLAGLIPPELDGANLTENAAKLCDLKNVRKQFLACLLNSEVPRDQMMGLIGKGTQPKLALFRIESLKIPLPSMEEQEKIAEVLGVVDSAIWLVDRVIWKTERLKKGLMQELLTKGIGHNEYKDTQIGKTPNTWQIEELGEMCNQRSGIVQPSGEGANRFIGLEHIAPGEITVQSYGSDVNIRSSKFRFCPKDILYGKLRPYLDKAVLVDLNGICSTDLLVLTAQQERALPEFLVYVLHSSEFIKHAIATTTGTNHPRTSWKAISKFEFGLPPLPEQRRISEILFTVNKKLELEKSEKARLERVKRGLMDLLLTGKVRVKVD